MRHPTYTSMSSFIPSVPISIQIRKIIFDNFNDTDQRFTGDKIFEMLQKNGDIDKGWTIDDMEGHFKEICDSGLTRCIAQDFTTQWFKLFDDIEKIHCSSCDNDVYLGKSEGRL